MVKRNITFHERKKKVITKTWTLLKGKVHIMNLLGKGKIDITDFWG